PAAQNIAKPALSFEWLGETYVVAVADNYSCCDWRIVISAGAIAGCLRDCGLCMAAFGANRAGNVVVMAGYSVGRDFINTEHSTAASPDFVAAGLYATQ